MKYFILLFFSLLLSACASEPNEEQKEYFKYQLTIEDTLSIPLPDSIEFPKGIPVFNYSERYFGYFDKMFDIRKATELYLNYFDFETKKWGIIPMKIKGPNGISFAGNFQFIDDNHILFLPHYLGEVYVINFDGIIEKRIKYPEDKLIPYAIRFTAELSDDGLLIPCLSSSATSDIDLFAKEKLVQFVDLTADKYEDLVRVPKSYLATQPNMELVGDICAEFLFEENKIIFGFNKDHNIYAYDIKEKKTNSYFVRNENLKIGTTHNKKLERDHFALLDAMNGLYSALLFDSEKGRYYRISHYYDVKEDVNQLSYPQLQKLNAKAVREGKLMTSVTVVDENFDVIAQAHFSNLNYYSYFIRKGNLYIQINKNDNENELKFIQLSLK